MKLNKIDFALVFTVNKANPNGDPNNGNRPRTNYEGLGEITDVCLKRKLRNRLLDLGASILVQAENKTNDNYSSIRERLEAVEEIKDAATKGATKKEYQIVSCENFYDVRAFGQVIPFKGGIDESGKKTKGLSVGIRGPVTIQNAYSISPVTVISNKITKSVNLETTDKGELSSDRMGDKHYVDFGLYVAYGSINSYLAEETNFTMNDAELLKEALTTIFENDCSSARPDGSMEVVNLYWWEHNCPSGQYSAAKVHRSLKVEATSDNPLTLNDYQINIEPLEGLQVAVFEGF